MVSGHTVAGGRKRIEVFVQMVERHALDEENDGQRREPGKCDPAVDLLALLGRHFEGA